MDTIDFTDISTHPFLSKLQGNILKGHGREHTTHIFVHFDKNGEKKAKDWLKKFAKKYLTNCLKQLLEREAFKKQKIEGGIFSSLFLTKSGLDYLKLKNKLSDEAFICGMKSRKDILNDPEKSNWEVGFRDDSHIMILLADNDIFRMGNLARTIIEEVDKFGHILMIEYGNAIKNERGDGLEHFGYVDGISQPLFLKDEIDDYMSFPNSIAGKVKFDPAADKELVLFTDPYANDDEAMGSYFVFRKLEQNVRGFKKAEEKLKEKLQDDIKEKLGKNEELGELAGAYLVGRFEDGTPVVTQDIDGFDGSGAFNNFDYDNDPSGGRCPHFAHIRKTNPRNGPDHKARIMARRGIPFGHREVPTEIEQNFAQMPEKGVGLLFMSYQASIVEQFEFIQKKWANDIVSPPETKTGIDPIIGESDEKSHKYRFPLEYSNGENLSDEISFGKFVTMKGGEYFFAPSIPFFENL